MGWFEQMEKLFNELEAEDKERYNNLPKFCRGDRCCVRSAGIILDKDDSLRETMRDLIERLP